MKKIKLNIRASYIVLRLWEILKQVFTDLLSNSVKRSPRFSPGYEGTENMFYFLNNEPKEQLERSGERLLAP